MTKKLTEKELEDFNLTDEQKKAIPKINNMISQLNFYTGQEFHVYPDEFFIIANKSEDDEIYFSEKNILDMVDILEGVLRICTYVIIQDDMEDELIK